MTLLSIKPFHFHSIKFGLNNVDFSDPSRPRTPKESSNYYSQIVAANGFVESQYPCSNGQQKDVYDEVHIEVA